MCRSLTSGTAKGDARPSGMRQVPAKETNQFFKTGGAIFPMHRISSMVSFLS